MASSATNFLATIIAVRSLDLDGVGAFFVAYSIATMALMIFRAVLGQPFLIAVTRLEQECRAGLILNAVGLGAGLAVLTAGIAILFMNGPLRDSTIAVAAGFPVLLAFEARRYSFLATRSYRSAFVLDISWGIALLLVASAAFSLVANAPVQLPLLLWWVSALMVLVPDLFLRTHGHRGKPKFWLRDLGNLARPILVESALARFVPQLSVYTVAAIAGLEATAALGGARALFGLITAATLGLASIGIVEVGSNPQLRSSRGTARRLGTLLGAVTLAIALGFTLVGSGLELLVGQNWMAISNLLVPVGISTSLASYIGVQVIWMRALAAVRVSVKIQAFSSAALLILATVGATVGGASGAAWGTGLSRAASIAFWDKALGRAVKFGQDS